MEAHEFAEIRRKRYLAQVLDDFDSNIAPHVIPGHESEVESFKQLVRQRLQAFAEDARDMLSMDPETHINAIAVAVVDRLRGT